MPLTVRNTKTGWGSDITVYPAGTVMIQSDVGEVQCVHKVADGKRAWYEKKQPDWVGPDVLAWIAPAQQQIIIATSYTLVAIPGTNYFIRIQAGGTLNLPTAVGYTPGTIVVVNEHSADHNIVPFGSETIAGGAAGAALVLPQDHGVRIYSDNTNWRQSP
jgi:hypothetical protein